MARRRFVPTRMRCPTFWAGIALNQTVTTGASVVTTVVSEADLENVPDPTLVRIRGDLIVQMTVSSGTPGRCVAGLGIIVVRASALAVPAVPSPLAQGDSDWVWWTSVGLNLQGGSVGSPNIDGNTISHRVIVDSKAMRKIKPNEAIVFVTENVVVSSTQTVDVLGGLRLLLKR